MMLQPTCRLKIVHGPLGFAHDTARQLDELAVAELHLLSARLREGLRSAVDLEHAMLGRPGMVHDLERCRLAFVCDAAERAGEHPQSVGEQ